MSVDDRPGDTYDNIINGYLVTMKNHDDRCSGMHGSYSCNCGADSYNKRARTEAESQPAKNPPDKIPPTYYQLTQRMAQALQLISDLHIAHRGKCSQGKWTDDISPDTCICAAKKERKNLESARELLKLG